MGFWTIAALYPPLLAFGWSAIVLWHSFILSRRLGSTSRSTRAATIFQKSVDSPRSCSIKRVQFALPAKWPPPVAAVVARYNASQATNVPSVKKDFSIQPSSAVWRSRQDLKTPFGLRCLSCDHLRKWPNKRSTNAGYISSEPAIAELARELRC